MLDELNLIPVLAKAVHWMMANHHFPTGIGPLEVGCQLLQTRGIREIPNMSLRVNQRKLAASWQLSAPQSHAKCGISCHFDATCVLMFMMC